MPQSVSQSIFLDAVQTMNMSIEENKNSLFFRTLLNACESLHEDDLMGVSIYYSDPETPHDHYTICMSAGKFQLVNHSQRQTHTDWSVSEDYLRDLANNRDKYIKHPEKLSLNWLAERLMASAR